MSALNYVHKTIIPVAFSLLPAPMASVEAHAFLLTEGLQESRFEHRFQIGGPAHGFWQFESGGGWNGVMTHPAVRDTARGLLTMMAYGEPDLSDYKGIAHNDVLACCLARLLVYTHPLRLPRRGEHAYAWQYYLDVWRPGKPKRKTWNAFYDQAWDLVGDGSL